jgi:hypothetical protein
MENDNVTKPGADQMAAALAKVNLRIDRLAELCIKQQAALAKLGQAVDNHQRILEAQGWTEPPAAGTAN